MSTARVQITGYISEQSIKETSKGKQRFEVSYIGAGGRVRYAACWTRLPSLPLKCRVECVGQWLPPGKFLNKAGVLVLKNQAYIYKINILGTPTTRGVTLDEKELCKPLNNDDLEGHEEYDTEYFIFEETNETP